MNIDEIPTPESDAAYKQLLLESDKSHRIRMRSKMRDLERRLTVSREALKIVARYPIARTHLDGPCLDRFDILEVCRALALTATEL